ncbi:hypothetical protein GQ43DRAFT_252324 [Delitschia confertaspora ATCC 74209]|uniref:Uncharacterized protein n=1 Tax=Delitschia confertaspora ATCC 74209 TaxID=1513339 RepID=A0A9P4JC52_9PLEO|nr:hypothetical protein GQ43DRAFT_252324 [Delitschia confertaspora ATCC 74209]
MGNFSFASSCPLPEVDNFSFHHSWLYIFPPLFAASCSQIFTSCAVSQYLRKAKCHRF